MHLWRVYLVFTNKKIINHQIFHTGPLKYEFISRDESVTASAHQTGTRRSPPSRSPSVPGRSSPGRCWRQRARLQSELCPGRPQPCSPERNWVAASASCASGTQWSLWRWGRWPAQWRGPWWRLAEWSRREATEAPRVGPGTGRRWRKKNLVACLQNSAPRKKKKKKDGQVKKSCFSPAAPWMFNVSAATEIRCPQV